MTTIWPMQCKCGHIFTEKYQLPKPNENGEIGFCWCGFCRTKRMVKEYKPAGVAMPTTEIATQVKGL